MPFQDHFRVANDRIFEHLGDDTAVYSRASVVLGTVLGRFSSDENETLSTSARQPLFDVRDDEPVFAPYPLRDDELVIQGNTYLVKDIEDTDLGRITLVLELQP